MQTTRQQRAWDLASIAMPLGEKLTDRYRILTLKALRLSGGEAVIDVGCGTGSNIKVLQRAVGPTGRIVGTEFSPKMLAQAKRRIAENRWDNVEVRAGDATKDPLGVEEYDAVLAHCSLSAMSDIDAAISNIYRALRPGGKLMVWDVQPRGLFRAAYRLIANAPGEEVAGKVRAVFDHADMLNGNAEPVPWRDGPMWFTLVLATKAEPES